MECATVSCSMDDGCSTVLQDKIVTAAKQHKCCECRKAINKGEKYKVEVTVYDGEIARHKTCLDCISIRDVFFKDGFYWRMVKEMLWDHIMECYGNIAESSVSSLSHTAQGVVCGIIEEAWERYEDDDED